MISESLLSKINYSLAHVTFRKCNRINPLLFKTMSRISEDDDGVEVDKNKKNGGELMLVGVEEEEGRRWFNGLIFFSTGIFFMR